ncbi:5-formyltetrahydrofolate cyclo-ligase [Pontimonas sp.]|jgi:5-formyltetrahydrofolate cyclo-ligase|uniref:5-formyltetrahydrofolate cyclo-ligase n=1 Tax=Pontimonas sp. TaxID=2304492 RepID=UPI0028709F39|nr:5-formyltetrahydrofolate cyclo-ligase [Pontimonas sp.]MDR9397050.1 5-formyltetrahydrofolate cyclo-ligase [Pontimonas sp.]MDR9434985.1 5-formyltetrahydrofolate cyclo-ligase [Pontimonas sp.]
MAEASPSGNPADKPALRAEARERRRIMTQDEKTAASTGLGENLRALTAQYRAKKIACYLSGTDEPTTRDFIDWALQEGIDVLVPVSREDGLMDWARCDHEGEGLDVLGMPIPTSELLGPMAVDGVDVMFIPASLVDVEGGRMGWGRGYFDRMLGSMALRPPVFAVVYDHEVIDNVPIEAHDQGVDGAVTPTQIIRFG